MEKTYYVVKKGHIPGIYEELWEAMEQVKYFADAEYAIFSDREEAELYHEIWEYERFVDNTVKMPKAYIACLKKENSLQPRYGLGRLFLAQSEPMQAFCETGEETDEELLTLFGTIRACEDVICHALDLNLKQLKIEIYDETFKEIAHEVELMDTRRSWVDYSEEKLARLDRRVPKGGYYLRKRVMTVQDEKLLNKLLNDEQLPQQVKNFCRNLSSWRRKISIRIEYCNRAAGGLLRAYRLACHAAK